MSVYSESHPALLTSQPSPYAPALLAAYAAGAVLWAPVLVLVSGLLAGLFAWLVPGVPAIGGPPMFAVVWALRFTLYVLGARAGWNYGYGINGVIVNRRLGLAGKARRIATDWFGILLMLVWLWCMPGVLTATMAQ